MSARGRIPTHGMARRGNTARVYDIWCGMKNRCQNPKTPDFKHYGGRGITVCGHWQKFENFLADMGEPPLGLSLDRYPDNDGNYEPGNCRWATRRQQKINTRAARMVTFRGKTQSLAIWAEEIGCTYRFLYRTFNMV